MKAGLSLVLSLMLAGCGQRDDVAGSAPDTNQIERLATPKEPEPDIQASARLQPIGRLSAIGLNPAESHCSFSRNGEVLLWASGEGATVRIGGRVRRLGHASPVGPSGGFFVAMPLRISVGRTAEDERVEGQARGWPARVTTTNRLTRAQTEVGGLWAC